MIRVVILICSGIKSPAELYFVVRGMFTSRSTMRKVAADQEGSLKRPVITHWKEQRFSGKECDYKVAYALGRKDRVNLASYFSN